jgi:hypothetical protein
LANEVHVDPTVLAAAAKACDGLRDSLSHDVADVEPETIDAARGLPGWYTKRALEDLLWWWRDDLTKLGRYLDTFSGALQTAGHDYQVSDHSSVDRFDFRGR